MNIEIIGKGARLCDAARHLSDLELGDGYPGSLIILPIPTSRDGVHITGTNTPLSELFIDKGSFVLNVLKVIQTYAPLVVVGIVGLEFVSTKNLLIRVAFYVAIALVVIFMFYPGTWSEFVGVVNNIK